MGRFEARLCRSRERKISEGGKGFFCILSFVHQVSYSSIVKRINEMSYHVLDGLRKLLDFDIIALPLLHPILPLRFRRPCPASNT